MISLPIASENNAPLNTSVLFTMLPPHPHMLLLLNEVQLRWCQMRRHGVGVKQMWVVLRHQRMKETKRQTRMTVCMAQTQVRKRNCKWKSGMSMMNSVPIASENNAPLHTCVLFTMLPPHPPIQCWGGSAVKALTKRSVFFASTRELKMEQH